MIVHRLEANKITPMRRFKQRPQTAYFIKYITTIIRWLKVTNAEIQSLNIDTYNQVRIFKPMLIRYKTDKHITTEIILSKHRLSALHGQE